MGVYSTVAGAADHLAGSTDEAFGRFSSRNTDTTVSGTSADPARSGADDAARRAREQAEQGRVWYPGESDPSGSTGVLDEVLGSADESLARGTADSIIDVVWSGHPGDTADLVGPTAWGTEGSLADVAVSNQNEASSPQERKTKLLVFAAIAGVALYLLAPLLQLLTGVVGADG